MRKYIECIDEDSRSCCISVGDVIEIDGIGIVEVTGIRDEETLEIKKATFKQKAEFYLDAGRRVRYVSDDEVSDIMSFACWLDSYQKPAKAVPPPPPRPKPHPIP